MNIRKGNLPPPRLWSELHWVHGIPGQPTTLAIRCQPDGMWFITTGLGAGVKRISIPLPTKEAALMMLEMGVYPVTD